MKNYHDFKDKIETENIENSSRINGVSNQFIDFKTRFDKINDELDINIVKINTRIDLMDSRFNKIDSVESRINDALSNMNEEVLQKIKEINGQIDGMIFDHLQEYNNKIISLSNTVEDNKVKLEDRLYNTQKDVYNQINDIKQKSLMIEQMLKDRDTTLESKLNQIQVQQQKEIVVEKNDKHLPKKSKTDNLLESDNEEDYKKDKNVKVIMSDEIERKFKEIDSDINNLMNDINELKKQSIDN